MATETLLTGAWSIFEKKLTEKELEVFNSTPKPFGVDYTPVQAMHQVVNGINYHFWCNTKISGPQPSPGQAVVTIHAPLNGEPEIVNITAIP